MEALGVALFWLTIAFVHKYDFLSPSSTVLEISTILHFDLPANCSHPFVHAPNGLLHKPFQEGGINFRSLAHR